MLTVSRNSSIYPSRSICLKNKKPYSTFERYFEAIKYIFFNVKRNAVKSMCQNYPIYLLWILFNDSPLNTELSCYIDDR